MNTTTNTARQTIEIEITLQGETRTVAFAYRAGDDRANSEYIFGCRVGNGTKIHLTQGMAYLTNGEWKFHKNSGYALNGTRQITNWADTVSQGAKSQHNSTAIA